MKTVAVILAICMTLLASLVYATDMELSVAANIVDDNVEDKSTMGNAGKLQIGKNKTKNDGVEFFVDEIKLSKVPVELQKDSILGVEIEIVNSTSEKAYLSGWFDFDNDGNYQDNEKILYEEIVSSGNSKPVIVKRELNFQNIQMNSNNLFLAYFELSTSPSEITIQGMENNDSSSRKISDLAMQDEADWSIETRAEGGGYELYDIRIIDEEPVAVILSSFNAIEAVNGITLEWKVENEMNHAGYNLYRSENEESGYTKINETIILGWDGFSAFDGSYEYTDAVHGAYYYKLEAIEMDGDTELFGPYSVMSSTGVEDKLEMPESFELKQNYPNPFNPSTTISFSLAEYSNVNVTVFDMTGRIVTILVDAAMDAGTHSVTWNAVDSFGASLPTGAYFYTMTTDDFTNTKSMTVIK
jgi:flagellar hook assembly protein FlgD